MHGQANGLGANGGAFFSHAMDRKLLKRIGVHRIAAAEKDFGEDQKPAAAAQVLGFSDRRRQ